MYDDNTELIDGPGSAAAVAAKPKRVRKAKAPAKSKAIRKKLAKRKPARKAKRPARRSKKPEGYGPREAVTLRIMHANPSAKHAAPEGTCYAALQKAFGKGRTLGDAIEWMVKNWEAPRAERFKEDPRSYLLGYISRSTVLGFLLYGKA